MGLRRRVVDLIGMLLRLLFVSGLRIVLWRLVVDWLILMMVGFGSLT